MLSNSEIYRESVFTFLHQLHIVNIYILRIKIQIYINIYWSDEASVKKMKYFYWIKVFLNFFKICLSVYLSICLPTYLPIYRSIYLSIHLSIYPSIYLSIHLSIYLSIYLSKETELKRLIEIWLVIIIVNFYRDYSLCYSLLNGNAFRWFQLCHFYVIVTWYSD